MKTPFSLALLFYLLFVASCSLQSVDVQTQWPNNLDEITATREEVKMPQGKNIVYEEIESTLSLERDVPRHILVNGQNVSLELLGITDKNKTRLSINGVAFLLGENETFFRDGLQFKIIDTAPFSVLVPRKSTVTLLVENFAFRLLVGDSIYYENFNITAKYIFEEEGIPTVNFIINGENHLFSRGQEIFIEEKQFYVQEIHYFNASFFERVGAITLTVR